MNLHLKLSYMNWKFTLTLGCLNPQSWTKVLGTVLQYSYFSVMSRFPLTRVHPFRNFLAVLPPPPPPTPHPATLYKVETGKKFWIHASNIVCCLLFVGVGPVWIVKRSRNAKVSQDLLSMIAAMKKPGPWQNREEAVSNFFKGRVTIKVKFDGWRTIIQ